MRAKNNIQTLYQTLQICEQGYYCTVDGTRVNLALTRDQMQSCHVYLPEDIRQRVYQEKINQIDNEVTQIKCLNVDSFTVAAQRTTDDSQRVLVLNMANSVHPGGGVRGGANAQEEELCRRSTLLVSLEGACAEVYYRYNRKLNNSMGSNAVVISPYVEVFRGEDGNLLDKTFVVSVLTCAAPNLYYGLGQMTKETYQLMFYERIQGMLKVAACLGYQKLVLGAFGCGAFGNDAKLVAELFNRALKSRWIGGKSLQEIFTSVDFAVLDRSVERYNYNSFARIFD